MTLTKGNVTAIVLGLFSIIPEIQELFGMGTEAYAACKVAILPVITKATAVIGLLVALNSRSVKG